MSRLNQAQIEGSDPKGQRPEELTEDELARRVYHLNTLYELNQEISALRNIKEVMEASLLYIIGVFGLKRGLFAIYKGDKSHSPELACRGIEKQGAVSWLQKIEPKMRGISSEGDPSPNFELLDDLLFQVWLPLEVDEQRWGGIALGSKLSEVDFTPNELELLSTIAINIQNVLNNVSLIEALHQSVVKETRIRNVFQRYAPEAVVNEVLNPSNEELLLGESQAVKGMFDQMIARLEEQHALEKDLDLARDVQAYLLPDKPPQLPGIEIAARSIPARGVCGDFYDFIPLGADEIGLSLSDIAGKGVPAAIIAVMLQSATRMCVGSYYPVPAILSILNRFMFRHTERRRFATMFYGQLNAQERLLIYSSAGHPPSILCRNGKIKLLETGGPCVGVFQHCIYDQETIELQPKDVLVIYSDGVIDAGTTPETVDPEDTFGQERLELAIASNASLSADGILEAICEEVALYASGNKQFDDITLIVMKVE